MRHSRVATLGVALTIGLGSLGAIGTPVRAAGQTGARPEDKAGPLLATAQEADVVAVVLDPQSHQPVVLLQGKRDKRNLAMAIGQFEANGIAIPLQGVSPPRPLTHDLMLTLLGDLRAALRRIVITDLRDDIYYAQLYLDVQGGSLTVDSRPSDAIALALRAKVPILVEDRVFDKAERVAPKPGATPVF